MPPRGIAVVVTGGREYTQVRALYRVLDRVHRQKHIRRLAHGAQRGADLAAAGWCALNGVEVQPYPVTDDDWRQHKKSAGPRRNRHMLTTEQPDVVIAFPGNRGTADCIRQAKRLGFTVWEPFAGVRCA